MNKISVKINKYGNNINVVNHGNLNSKILNFIFYSFGVLALCYVFILSNMILNIIERRSLESDMRNLSNELSELELEYLAKSGSIDLEYSYALGFEDTKVNYATRKSLGQIKLAKNDL